MTAGTSALLVLIGGGVAGVAALTTRNKSRIGSAVAQPAAAAPQVGREPADVPFRSPAAPPRLGAQATIPRTSDEADRTATRAPRRPGARRTQVPVPVVTIPAVPAPPPAAAPAQPIRTTVTRTETETHEIPFETRLIRDPSLPHGTRQIRTPGVPGEQTVRYQVTVVDGQVTDRRLLDAAVTREPQHRVVAFGSRPGADHGRHRECGRTLDVCVPLGRTAVCPVLSPAPGPADGTKRGDDRAEGAAGEQEDAVQTGGSVTVLDRDIELLDAEQLDALEGMADC